MTVATITPQELAECCRQGRPLELIDVRTPVEFREVHVPAARNVPLDRLEPATFLHKATAEPLYVICRAGARGKQACERLIAAGHTNIVNVEGGTLAWIACGLPVVRGKKAMSLERQVRITVGFMVLVGVVLGWVLHPALSGIAAFMGAGLLFAGITDRCGLAMLLARMPWNRVGETPACCTQQSPGAAA